MNLDLSSLELPIFLRTDAPMSDLEFMRFSRENRPCRMEREPNEEILVMNGIGCTAGLIAGKIIVALGRWADEDGRGISFAADTGFALANGAVRAPSTAWLSNEKWKTLSVEEQEGFAPLCPEFVVELRSPSDRKEDVEAKMVNEWIANGAEVGWTIEPKDRRVTVYRLGQEAEVFEDPILVKGTGCVAGFELVMEKVWGRA